MNYYTDFNDTNSNDSNITLLSLLTNLNPYSENNERNDYCPLNLECSLNSCPYSSNQYFDKKQEVQSQETPYVVDFKNLNSIPTSKPDEIVTPSSTSDPVPMSCPCSIAFSETICIPQGVMHNVNEGTKKVLKPIHFNIDNVQNKYQKQRTPQKNQNHTGLCIIC